MTLHVLEESSPIFKGLPAASISFLESIAKEIAFEPGLVIFEEDAPAEYFYLVTTGKVGLEVSLHTGPAMLIETLGPGDLLGVSWLFPPYRWNWRARALVAGTALALHSESVRNRCESDPDLALQLYKAVAEEAVRRLHATRMRLLDLYPGMTE